MKSKFLAVILVLSMLFVIPGCAPKPLTCPANELQAASLLYPPWRGRGISLTPTLSWEYPTSPSGCLPEKYHITLRVGPFFNDDLGGDTTGPVTSWTPAVPLQPGTEYMWTIQPMVGGVPVPYIDLSYDVSYFYTGPTCNTEALVAPNLLDPANGAVITDGAPVLIWDYPQDCTTDEYLINLSTTADFSDTSLGDWTTTGSPSTSWLTWPPLDDCMTYYWKVRALNGDTPSLASSTFSFRLDKTGTCQPTVIGGSIIHIQSNASCRFGPGEMYDNLTFVAVGDVVSLVARNDDSSWFYGRAPDGILCWVGAATGALTGDPAGQLPVRESPPTPTFSPSIFRLEKNAACRSGPGTMYDNLTFVAVGDVVSLLARNADNSWFYGRAPDGILCWIGAATGALTGDPFGLPIREAPPTPTPTQPVSCASYTSSDACEANPECVWVEPPPDVPGPGHCGTQ